MTADPTEPRSPGAMHWWIAAGVGALVAVLGLQLLWMAYRYVPLHAAIFEGMGMELPRDARLVIAAANWVPRMLPFVVLAAVPLAVLAIVGVVVVALKVPMRTVVGVLTGLGLAIALAECATSAYVVHALHGVYLKASTSEAYQRNLRELDECRREKRNALAPAADQR